MSILFAKVLNIFSPDYFMYLIIFRAKIQEFEDKKKNSQADLRSGLGALAVTKLVLPLHSSLPLSPYPTLQPLGYQTLEKLHSAKATHRRSKCQRNRTSGRRSPHRLQSQPLGQSQHNQSPHRPHEKPASKHNFLNLQKLIFL